MYTPTLPPDKIDTTLRRAGLPPLADCTPDQLKAARRVLAKAAGQKARKQARQNPPSGPREW